MNKNLLWTALVALGLGVTGGYWLAYKSMGDTSITVQAEQEALFYRNPPPRDGGSAESVLPINPPVTSPIQAKDGMGMDHAPVDKDASPTETAGQAAPGPESKILYYRNPMGLADTSPVPKKDAMGMDYIPVYEEEPDNKTNILRVSTEKIQRLGVKTALVENTEITHIVRSVGNIDVDERRLANVTLRFDGFIEKLYVNATGQTVTRGQPLFELYSPALVAAQREYLAARNGQAALDNSEAWVQSGIRNVTESSLERLRLWGISGADLVGLQHGKVSNTMVVRSPASGVIMEKTVVAGVKAMSGDILYKIADLSQVWVIAEVYEHDIGVIKQGQTVLATLDAYPGRTFIGKVGFIYPMLNPATRTVKVRVELPNPDGLLKPMMFAQIAINTQAHQTLAIPRSAVLESGRRTLVLVDRGEGRFEPRPVRVGLRGEELTEILEGLNEHERVVVSANFLIDAESNLKAALGGFEPVEPAAKATNLPSTLPTPNGEHSHQGGL